MTLELLDLSKLCNSQAAITSAYRAALSLQEQGWTRYPAVSWDKPAVVAFDGEQCVAGVNFAEDGDDLIFRVDFAWCTRPDALAPVLLRTRQKIRDSRCKHIAFGCHTGNDKMAKMVGILGIQPHLLSYQFAIKRNSGAGGPA